MKDFFTAVGVVILFSFIAIGMVSPIIGLAMWLEFATCSSRAERMDMAHSWGPLQGCMIEYKPKQWIHIKNYRAVDLP